MWDLGIDLTALTYKQPGVHDENIDDHFRGAPHQEWDIESCGQIK
jgi:hypothetical protein